MENANVTAVGAAVSGFGKLCAELDPAKAMVLPAVALGSDGYTLAVPVWREGRQSGWLVAQLAIIGYVSWMQPTTAIAGVLVLLLGSLLPPSQATATPTER